MIFVGNDSSEDHHDIEVLDEQGRRLARRRLPEGVAGVAAFHELVGEHVEDPAEVVIGIETDRGLWWRRWSAPASVYTINPKAVARYREHHGGSGAKSDPGMPRCSPTWSAPTVTTIARWPATAPRPKRSRPWPGPQRLVWARRHRSTLCGPPWEYYQAALVAFDEDLAHPDAVAVLERAPSPDKGRALSVSAVAAALRRGGRRALDDRARQIRDALRSEQLTPPAELSTPARRWSAPRWRCWRR